MIIAKIDVTKILKQHIFEGKKGKYLELVLMENRDGPDQFGNDFMVVQGVSKEARLAGEKGPILGNAQYKGKGQDRSPARDARGGQQRPVNSGSYEDDDLDSIPF